MIGAVMIVMIVLIHSTAMKEGRRSPFTQPWVFTTRGTPAPTPAPASAPAAGRPCAPALAPAPAVLWSISRPPPSAGL